MKNLLPLLLLCLCALAVKAGFIVIFNPTSSPVTNRVTQVIPSGDTLYWRTQTNALVDVLSVPATNIDQWKVSNGLVLALSAADSIAITNAAWLTLTNSLTNNVIFQRTNAATVFSATDSRARVEETILEIILSEVNILRVNVALAIRTTNQMKTAISNALQNATQ